MAKAEKKDSTPNDGVFLTLSDVDNIGVYLERAQDLVALAEQQDAGRGKDSELLTLLSLAGEQLARIDEIMSLAGASHG